MNDYEIQRSISDTVDIKEFQFDILTPRYPLVYFIPLTVQKELGELCLSTSYSLTKKKKKIKEIMRSYGFKLLSQGTNRFVFTHPMDLDVVFKVAFDDVSYNDANLEFRNQMIKKPFVAKTYEVSPYATISMCERVLPIGTTKEFISSAKEIYQIISTWFVGKYMLVDFGSNYIKNWGIRTGFGPVLLDYPYMYELDPHKLICRCGGKIQYDDGYNKILCPKCGILYEPREVCYNRPFYIPIKNKKIKFKKRRNNMSSIELDLMIINIKNIDEEGYINPHCSISHSSLSPEKKDKYKQPQTENGKQKEALLSLDKHEYVVDTSSTEVLIEGPVDDDNTDDNNDLDEKYSSINEIADEEYPDISYDDLDEYSDTDDEELLKNNYSVYNNKKSKKYDPDFYNR